MLEQQTQQTVSDNMMLADDQDGYSMSSMPFNSLRASFPSQSGATKTHLLKTAKQPQNSLLARYNQNISKHQNRANN